MSRESRWGRKGACLEVGVLRFREGGAREVRGEGGRSKKGKLGLLRKVEVEEKGAGREKEVEIWR